MKFGFRKPSIKKSIKAKTTGRAKRSMKKAINPSYGTKGIGYVKNPKKAIYNNIYNKTTVGINIESSNRTNTPIRTQNNSINTKINFSLFNKTALQKVSIMSSHYGKEKHDFNKKIIEKYKDSNNSEDMLAVAISYLGERATFRKDAIIYFENYLKSPTNQTYFSNWIIYSDLAELYEKEYKFDEAIKCLQKLIELDGNSNCADYIRIGNVLTKIDINKAFNYYENLQKEKIYKDNKKAFDEAFKDVLLKKQRNYIYRPKQKNG